MAYFPDMCQPGWWILDHLNTLNTPEEEKNEGNLVSVESDVCRWMLCIKLYIRDSKQLSNVGSVFPI